MVKRIMLSAALALTCITVSAQAELTVKERLQQHLGYLASDAMCGREAGTATARLAATYIADQFAQIGLKPFGDTTYYAYFNQGSALGEGDRYCDVIGMLEGSDPVLKDEVVIIGAHYDHLGIMGGEVYNGADDNASGTSALIEVARILAARRSELKRTVIFAAFDAEEVGLYGSTALAKTLAPLEVYEKDNEDVWVHRPHKVCLMVSADMVGWLRANGRLEVEGVNTLKHGGDILEEIASEHGIVLETKGFEGSLFTATDTQGFAVLHVPTLAVSTGLKSPYHKPGDDVEYIDFDGLEKVTGYLADVMAAAADGGSLQPSGRVAKIHRGKELLEFGITGGIGSTNARFAKESAFIGKSNLVGSLGVAAQLNLGSHLAIRPEAYFEAGALCLPSSAPASHFDTSYNFHYGRVMAPVSLLLKTGTGGSLIPTYMYLGGGVNWSFDIYSQMHRPDIKNSADPFGWHWILGMNLKKSAFEVMCTYPLKGLDCEECETFGTVKSCTSQFRLIRWF